MIKSMLMFYQSNSSGNTQNNLLFFVLTSSGLSSRMKTKSNRESKALPILYKKIHIIKYSWQVNCGVFSIIFYKD